MTVLTTGRSSRAGLRFPLMLLLSLLSHRAAAQFPYSESFKNATAPGMVFGGTPSAFLTDGAGSIAYSSPATITDAAGDGYLRLTNKVTNQAGYVYGSASFPSTYGIVASFEYFSYGGSGNGADGLCFFLFDATASPFNVGGFGGSLGYGNRSAEPGVSKGYLGIGLDEHGNFSNPSEGRVGGPGQKSMSVTIRGAGSGTGNVYNGVANENYKFIATAQTTAMTPAFSLTGGSSNSTRAPLITNAAYRRAEITLVPKTVTVGSTTGTSYNITVRITVGGSATGTTYTVLDNVTGFTTIAPPNLRYGLTASTGSVTNFHEVRNLTINAYSTPISQPAAANISATACNNAPAEFSAFQGATGVNVPVAFDSNSVRFINPTNTADTVSSYTIAGVGTFSAGTLPGSQGLVTFAPVAGYTGTAGIDYVFKDNYGVKTSNAAILTVTVLPALTNSVIANGTPPQQLTGNAISGGSGTVSYLWERSLTSATSGFSAAPGTNNGQNYLVSTPSQRSWFRRSVSAGCVQYSEVRGFEAGGIPLAVKLTGFEVLLQKAQVKIRWQTAAETSCDRFEVERSGNGRDYRSIASVKSSGGSVSLQRYEITDEAPIAGVSFYRLAQYDLDGTVCYSETRSLHMGDAAAAFRLVENPVREVLGADGAAGAVYTITDMTARCLLSGRGDVGGQLRLDVSALPAGVYLLRGEGGVLRFAKF